MQQLNGLDEFLKKEYQAGFMYSPAMLTKTIHKAMSGETSGAVLAHLGIDRLQVGPFAGPSLPLALDVTSTSTNSLSDPLVVCLKSGKLAGLDAFEVALYRMASGGPVVSAATAAEQPA